MNDRQPNLIVDLVPRSAVVGGVLGLLDFGVFELVVDPVRIREYVLYKPSLVGLSFWSAQLICFSAFAVALLMALLLISRNIRRTGAGQISSSLLAIVAATMSLIVVIVRLYKNPDFSLQLATFVACSTLVVAFLILARRGASRAVGSRDARSGMTLHGPLLLLIVMFLISSAAPDVYSLILRARQPARGSEFLRPNVLLIVMDTVRADHLSCYGYEKLTSPNVDRIAAEGMLFLNAFASAPWTLPSHASMFTGLYPSGHGATWAHPYLRETAQTIAEKLSDIGYETVGFSENPFVGTSYGLAQGFNEFHETWRTPALVHAVQRSGVRAFHLKNRLEYSTRTTGLLTRWLANHHAHRRPFFAFVNLMTAHHPRYPRRHHGSNGWRQEDLRRIEPVNLVPERFYLPQYRLTDRELSTMRDVYDSEIRYLDEQIAEITRALAQHDSLDNTVLILTSDHGENFGDHGFIEHQFCLYNSLIRVPLIIRFPSKITPGIVEQNVSTISLFDVILLIAGDLLKRTPENSTDYLSKEMIKNEPIFSEFSNAVKMLKNVLGDETSDFDYRPFDRDLKSVISGDEKLIWSSNGEHELYSLENDPDEADNLVRTRHATARELAGLLESWSGDQSPMFVSDRTPEIDRGTRDALRALGYER